MLLPVLFNLNTNKIPQNKAKNSRSVSNTSRTYFNQPEKETNLVSQLPPAVLKSDTSENSTFSFVVALGSALPHTACQSDSAQRSLK